MGLINPSLDAHHMPSTRNPVIFGGGLMDGRGAKPVPALRRRLQDGIVGNCNSNGDDVGSSGEGAYALGAGATATADPGHVETRRRPEYAHSTPMYSPHSRAWEMNDTDSNANPNQNPNTVPRLATNSHPGHHWDRDPQQQQQQHRNHQDGRPRDAYDRSEIYDHRDRHQDYPMDSPRYGSAQAPLSHGSQPIYGSSLTPSHHQTSSHPHQPAHPSTLLAMPASYNPVSVSQPERASLRPWSKPAACSSLSRAMEHYSWANATAVFSFLCPAHTLC